MRLAAGAGLWVGLVFFSGTAPPEPSARQAEVRETQWPDGKPRERYEVRVADGREVRDGEAQTWFENGETESKGSYADGLREGVWRFYYENGKRKAHGRFRQGERSGKWKLYYESGRLRAEGEYAHDRMQGPWTFYTPKGDPDPEKSGDYEWVELEDSAGRVRGEGYRKDGRLHGDWVYYWEDGGVQFAGRYRDGKREGPWIFHHPDGSYDEEVLSGLYVAGERVGPAPSSDLPAFAAPRPSKASVQEEVELREAGQYGDVDRLIDLATKGRGEKRHEAFDTLVAMGGRVVPAVLERLEEVDRAQPRELARAVQGYGGILKALCNGASYPFTHPSGDYDAQTVALATRRWATLWRLTRGTDFWEIDAPLLDPEDPRPLYEPPFPDEGPAEGPWFANDEARRLYALRFEAEREASVATAIQAGLDWLVGQQGREGLWDADRFPDDATILGVERMAYHDVGVSALAVLAALAEGNSSRTGHYRESVARGLFAIASRVGPDGNLETLLPPEEVVYDQAVAALALAEAAAQSPSPVLAERARRLGEWLLRAREDGAAWGEAGQAPGECNTSITAWAVQALYAARAAGLGLPEEDVERALEDARTWILGVSERRTGRIGFDQKGSRSLRVPQNAHYPRDKTETMTAAGLLCHALLGTDPGEEILGRHVYRIRRAPPAWSRDGATCDMIYWYFAGQALRQYDTAAFEEWQGVWRPMALLAQRKKGEAAGSWDPIGPWGFIGGRVYSTATMILGLTAPHRLPRLVPENAGRKRSNG